MVGKTLKSTGRRIYTATIITMTDSMMSTTIRKSSRKPGIGMMSAMTIATTAIGTPNSPNPAGKAKRSSAGFSGECDCFSHLVCLEPRS